MTIDNFVIIGIFRDCGAAITSMWLGLKADNAGLNARSEKSEADHQDIRDAVSDLRATANWCGAARMMPGRCGNPLLITWIIPCLLTPECVPGSAIPHSQLMSPPLHPSGS